MLTKGHKKPNINCICRLLLTFEYGRLNIYLKSRACFIVLTAA